MRQDILPWIPDRGLYLAVKYSRFLIATTDIYPGAAHGIAAEKFHVNPADVAHYVGIAAANSKKRRKKEGT
ncbi:hypothetical protein FACS1894164_11010 [Spirochaetia bacterium]|nr:hypothetical protein FACS1894164_11010 [Spirochaetia bacterium]